jgi:Protein of unknown function (DUF3037)
MTAKYTVVQYVPDPTADERINFGVITWDARHVRSRFVAHWSRIRSFGGEDVSFLRDFARGITELTSPQMPLPEIGGDKLDLSGLKKMIGEWSYSIQFTEPRGSLRDPQTLLEEAASVFLRPSEPRVRRGRSRRHAATLAYKFLLEAVKQQAPDCAENLVRPNKTLQGKLDEHRLDVVLANGKLLAALNALSFEISESEHLEREIQVTAWTIDDVRKLHRKLPLAIYMLPPLENDVSGSYTRATRLFKSLDADVVTSERAMKAWAKERTQSLAA